MAFCCFFNFGKHKSFFAGPLVPLFWSYSDVYAGFQSQGGSLCHLHGINSSDSLSVQLLMATTNCVAEYVLWPLENYISWSNCVNTLCKIWNICVLRIAEVKIMSSSILDTFLWKEWLAIVTHVVNGKAYQKTASNISFIFCPVFSPYWNKDNPSKHTDPLPFPAAPTPADIVIYIT